MSFRWLGVAGVELKTDDFTIIIDPSFTRPWFGMFVWLRARPKTDLIHEHIPQADAILVTHGHYDHLLDVPEAARLTGAPVYGSANIVNICRAVGLPEFQLHLVSVGDTFTLGPAQIDVTVSSHIHTPADFLINKPLPRRLRYPLRLSDYRMDQNLGYRITLGGQRFLFGKQPLPADIWFTMPYDPAQDIAEKNKTVGARRIVPIHWDDFFRPLHWQRRPAWRPVDLHAPYPRRMHLEQIQQELEAFNPGVEVLMPELFKDYPLE
ncbi:MAG TPA: MBL fold metallo-hydrolase [Longilinea sp.]|nr:MBL fold metallo-hydrolase [Longilinea sp.]